MSLSERGESDGAADVLARWASSAAPRLGRCRRDVERLRDNVSEMLRPEGSRASLGEIDDFLGAFLDAARLLAARDLEPGYLALQGAAANYARFQVRWGFLAPESD